MINRGTWESHGGGERGREGGRDRKREIQTDRQTDRHRHRDRKHSWFLPQHPKCWDYRPCCRACLKDFFVFNVHLFIFIIVCDFFLLCNNFTAQRLLGWSPESFNYLTFAFLPLKQQEYIGYVVRDRGNFFFSLRPTSFPDNLFLDIRVCSYGNSSFLCFLVLGMTQGSAFQLP